MGTYFWFGCNTDKEYIDFQSAKATEIRLSDFDNRLLTQFLMMKCMREPKVFEFLGDESGDWDRVTEEKWQDATCDVLIDMFEDGFIPEQWQFGWIYSKFKDMNRLEELSKWLIKFKK